MQAGVEPLRRVGRPDLAGQHRAHLVVVRPGLEFVVEVGVFEAPVGPAADQPVKDLAGVGLGAEGRIVGGLGAPQPLGDAVLRDADGTVGYPGLAEVLLGDDVGRDLGPAGRDLSVFQLEDHLAVGVDDPRGARLEDDAGVGVARGGIRTRKLHADCGPLRSPCAQNGESSIEQMFALVNPLGDTR